jgi:adenosine/AMP kinase
MSTNPAPASTFQVTFGQGDNLLALTGLDWDAVESAARTADMFRAAGHSDVVFVVRMEAR